MLRLVKFTRFSAAQAIDGLGTQSRYIKQNSSNFDIQNRQIQFKKIQRTFLGNLFGKKRTKDVPAMVIDKNSKQDQAKNPFTKEEAKIEVINLMEYFSNLLLGKLSANCQDSNQ